MTDAISSISSAVAPESIQLGTKSTSGGFGAVLEGAVASVEDVRNTASSAVDKFLTGEGDDLHATLLAVERAQLATDLFIQVRNKVVQAYQEVMKMQM